MLLSALPSALVSACKDEHTSTFYHQIASDSSSYTLQCILRFPMSGDRRDRSVARLWHTARIVRGSRFHVAYIRMVTPERVFYPFN